MIRLFRKALATIRQERDERGAYMVFLMYASHLLGLLRGLLYRVLYFANISGFLFAMQGSSKIEIFHKRASVRIGKFVFIRKNASLRVDYDGDLMLGDYVFINDNCNINCVNRVHIGARTKIAPNVCINDHDHDYKGVSGGRLLKGEVIIGNNVWIGSNVVVLRDTVIGDNAVIAAGSVVKGHVEPNTLFYNRRETRHIPIPSGSEAAAAAQPTPSGRGGAG
ncbi:acyltransferase [Paenibacillus antri]|uniref:Acyltransferase n=1 Tax=Paenibacillus antri TaxID=2582848 RepID=A0A5R9G8L1_9BACL|nr:acyltransferase [Paenibacillus antri]TLS49404.1 acyltransferase [Paenibacillus antri]